MFDKPFTTKKITKRKLKEKPEAFTKDVEPTIEVIEPTVESLKVGDEVTHPTFGLGLVDRVLADGKLSCVFGKARRDFHESELA